MIGIIEYGLGNVSAFVNIYKKLEVPCKIVRTNKDFDNITKLILPGVGAFDHAIDLFEKSGMRGKVEDLVLHKKIPVLGVCVGMQMMVDSSEEGRKAGLSWISGRVIKLDSKELDPGSPLPHMGWNELLINESDRILSGLNHSRFYFLHSYYVSLEDSESVIAEAVYGPKFCSVLKSNNIYGMQCHPEKSHESGIRFLKNFSEINKCCDPE